MEKDNIPAIAPRINTANLSINKFFNAVINNSYLFNNTKMNAPEIPGRIIAQMAIAPEKNNAIKELFVLKVVNPVNQIANTKPDKMYGKFFLWLPFVCLYTKMAEIKINPRKNE